MSEPTTNSVRRQQTTNATEPQANPIRRQQTTHTPEPSTDPVQRQQTAYVPPPLASHKRRASPLTQWLEVNDLRSDIISLAQSIYGDPTDNGDGCCFDIIPFRSRPRTSKNWKTILPKIRKEPEESSSHMYASVLILYTTPGNKNEWQRLVGIKGAGSAKEALEILLNEMQVIFGDMIETYKGKPVRHRMVPDMSFPGATGVRDVEPLSKKESGCDVM